MLGIMWDSQATTTQDIDIADVNTMPIGITNREIDLAAALKESELGVFEVPALELKSPSTSFKLHNVALQVDLLTPLHGKPSHKPVLLRHLKTYAQPLRFLDYLLEEIQPAIVAAKAGILVYVPTPARYAFHKLVISNRRPAYWQTKASKDIRQAEQIFLTLLQLRPGDITAAFEATQKQPVAFTQAMSKSWKKLSTNLRQRMLEETNIEL